MSAIGALGVGDGSMPDMLDTPDYTDSESNPTGANSVAGDLQTADGRKKRWEGNALRKSVFGKKHDELGQSKVGIFATTGL